MKLNHNEIESELKDSLVKISYSFFEIWEKYDGVPEWHDVACLIEHEGLDKCQAIAKSLVNKSEPVYEVDHRVSTFSLTWYPRITLNRAKKLAPELFEHKDVMEAELMFGEKTYFKPDITDDEPCYCWTNKDHKEQIKK